MVTNIFVNNVSKIITSVLISSNTNFQNNIKLNSSCSVFLYVNFRNCSYFQYKYSSQVEAAVNRQIQAEQQAAQDYLNMAVTLLHPSVSRPGAGGLFMRMFDEEIGHMKDFVHYQLLRGGACVICGLTAPAPKRSLSLLDAFTCGLEMEKTITQLLEDLVKTAEGVKDYQCADFVTSIFLAEQMKSISEMSHHVTKLKPLANDEHALYHYDQELLKSYPYTFKSKTFGA